MRSTVLVVLSGLMISTPAIAQVESVLKDYSAERRVIDFQAGQTVQVRGAPGFQIMVELSPDEQVRNVALGDSSAWQVDVSKEGSRLFLKPLRPDVRTNMTVVTSIRTYSFDLDASPDPESEIPYGISFRYPPPPPEATDLQYVDVSAAIRRTSQYQISGDRSIRPRSVSNDGRRTYIEWPKDAQIPATYAVSASGNQVLANGMMGTDDVYVVDGVPLELEFRIDREVARAKRVTGRKSR